MAPLTDDQLAVYWCGAGMTNVRHGGECDGDDWDGCAACHLVEWVMRVVDLCVDSHAPCDGVSFVVSKCGHSMPRTRFGQGKLSSCCLLTLCSIVAPSMNIAGDIDGRL